VKSAIDDFDPSSSKIRLGKPEHISTKIGQSCEVPLHQQLFEEEREILHNFKARHDICKSYSDEFIISCLWARKYDDARTLKLLQDNYQWRKTNGFEKIPTTDEMIPIIRALSYIYCCIPGTRDKQGGGLMYSVIKKDFEIGKEPLTVANMKKWTVWFYIVGNMMDGVDIMRNGMTIIQDMSEFSWNHFDIDTQKQLNVVTLFPFRVKRFVILNPPSFFHAIIKICKTFMSTKLLNRIESTTKVKDILNYVREDQLWTTFGGDVEYDPAKWVDHLIEFSRKHKSTLAVPLQ